MNGWVRVCAQSELAPGETRVVWDGDTAILVINLEGEVYAIEDQCTHEEFELSAGELDSGNGSIECALHGARFDVRSGAALCAPAYLPVPTFPVRIADGAIWTRDDRD